MSIKKQIGFLGAGQMAEAIARSLISKEVIKPDQVRCYDVNPGRIKVFEGFGSKGLQSNLEVISQSDISIICTKPQYVQSSLQGLQMSEQKLRNTIFVSIAAGITIKQIEKFIEGPCKVARLMPNTPCLVGEMAAGLSVNSIIQKEEASMLQQLFSNLGKVFLLDEKNLNAVTGLSGSGPAYIFQIIEAMSDGGVRAGLSREVATQLAAQTVYGASKMVLQLNQHPAVLKDQVTSPAGTTIAGLHELEKGGVRASFINAVLVASERAEEMSKD